MFKRTCLSVSYGATEAIMGEVNGLHSARGIIVSEGHQGGVVNHLWKPRRWRIPEPRNKWQAKSFQEQTDK